MPGGLSVKLACVLAAFAFVIAFRVHAGAEESPASAATTISSAGASALASDTSVQPAAKGVSAPGLSRLAALPALHRAPKVAHKKAPAKTAATPPSPSVSVAPVAPVTPVTPRAPVRTGKSKSYVGKSFDSKG